MTAILQRLRPLLIGLVVLLFTAGIALASKPSVSPAGLSTGAEASGQAVPVKAGDDEDEKAGGEEQDAEDQPEAVESDQTTETEADEGENCATDPTNLSPEARAALTHGSIVCWAAHQQAPDTYGNHGQWVSEWARGDHGQDAAAVDQEPADAPAAPVNGHAGKGKANKP